MLALFIVAARRLRAALRVPHAAADRHALPGDPAVQPQRRRPAGRGPDRRAPERGERRHPDDPQGRRGRRRPARRHPQAARLLHHQLGRHATRQGFPVPDGTYAITLRVRSGDKQFNTSRKMVVDTTAPRPASLTVTSATLAAAGPGQCRVSFTPADAGSVTFEARPFEGGDVVRTLGPRPAQADQELSAGTGPAWARPRRRRSGPGSTSSAPPCATRRATCSPASAPAGWGTSRARPGRRVRPRATRWA